MSRRWQTVLFLVAAGGALSVGFVLHPWGSEDPVTIPPPSSRSLMQAGLPDLGGKWHALTQWKGKVVVVNFWATWCAPCRKEIPALIQAQEKLGPKGLQIIGIAIDQVERIKPYAAQMRINYPVLVGGLDGIDLARQAGDDVGALPFTVIVDRAGEPIRVQLGGLTLERLEQIVEPLL